VVGDSILPLIIVFLALALIGAFVSILVLIPPLREFGRRSKNGRVAIIAVVAILSLGISFGLLTRLNALVNYVFSLVSPPPTLEVVGDPPVLQPPEDPLRSKIIQELWMRELIPPVMRQPCYSPNTIVCQKADKVQDEWKSGNPGAYWITLGICSLSSITGGVLAWVFTRKKRQAIFEEAKGNE
jgi:hypothetical protein